MSFWILVAIFPFGNIVETDLFYTKSRCEQFVKIVESYGAKASCQLVTVKE